MVRFLPFPSIGWAEAWSMRRPRKDWQDSTSIPW